MICPLFTILPSRFTKFRTKDMMTYSTELEEFIVHNEVRIESLFILQGVIVEGPNTESLWLDDGSGVLELLMELQSWRPGEYSSGT